MYYVYLIKSIKYPDKKYVGYTTDLKKRLKDHNEGKSIYTKNYSPWELILYLGFQDMKKAKDFEKYLKSNSGKAFSSKHF
jgi:predicted GIY-YIG superfamily endonuclease